LIPTSHLPRRRALLLAGATGVIGSALGARALAQSSYPSRPVRLVVGFAAGGPTDILARAIAPELAARLGQAVVVENRAGAAGLIGVDAVTAAPPDGHTLGLLAVTSVVSEALSGKPFDGGRTSPITLLYDQYNVLLVNPAYPVLANVHTLRDLLAVLKSRRDALDFTSAGHGSMGHLTMAWINSLSETRMQHVAYKGAGPALNDVLGGQIGVMFGDSISAAPHIRSGKLRPVAVSYPERVADLPQVPTVAEQGFPAVSGVPWVMLIGPPGMPSSLVDRLNGEIRAIYAKPEVAERIRSFKVTPKTTTPDASRAMIANEYAAWRKVVVENRIRAE